MGSSPTFQFCFLWIFYRAGRLPQPKTSAFSVINFFATPFNTTLKCHRAQNCRHTHTQLTYQRILSPRIIIQYSYFHVLTPSLTSHNINGVLFIIFLNHFIIWNNSLSNVIYCLDLKLFLILFYYYYFTTNWLNGCECVASPSFPLFYSESRPSSVSHISPHRLDLNNILHKFHWMREEEEEEMEEHRCWWRTLFLISSYHGSMYEVRKSPCTPTQSQSNKFLFFIINEAARAALVPASSWIFCYPPPVTSCSVIYCYHFACGWIHALLCPARHQRCQS